ncbi:hypothetical protein EON63_06495 [archaeon]|nr:MAG: hypothetical protein EON63_06495 [archaeon]
MQYTLYTTRTYACVHIHRHIRTHTPRTYPFPYTYTYTHTHILIPGKEECYQELAKVANALHIPVMRGSAAKGLNMPELATLLRKMVTEHTQGGQ